MAGGAMLGYWAIGSLTTARIPANMITIATTQAKMGLSMKKLTMCAGFLRSGCTRRGRRVRRSRPRYLRLHFLRLDGGARLDELQTLDDDTVSGLDAVGHDPLVSDRALGDELAQLDLVIRSDDEGRGVTLLIMGDSELREQEGHAVPLLDLLAHEHSREQGLVGVWEQSPQSHGPRRLIHGDIRELQFARQLIMAAVLERQVHLGLVAI